MAQQPIIAPSGLGQANRGQRSTGVVYLAWAGLGCDAFRRFLATYQRQPAGREHDLIVIYAGFNGRQALMEAHAVFRDIPHLAVDFADVKLDIGYYLETSRRLSHEYLCFLNTYTELKTPNWLAHLDAHAKRPGVGIVGATASYESLYSSVGLLHKVGWVCDSSGNAVTERAAYYYDFVIKHSRPNAVVQGEAPRPRGALNRLTDRTTRIVQQRAIDLGFDGYWADLTSPKGALADYRRFPAFPNPHIRSNGFMLRRDRLAAFDPAKIQTKLDACAFESGFDGLTAQLRRAGLAAVVVSNDGKGYDVDKWARSRTFRLFDQSSLILTDNRSREFEQMSEAARAVHARMTWGDHLGPAPPDFPDLGYRFAKGSLDPSMTDLNMLSATAGIDPVYMGSKLALGLLEFITPASPVGRAAGLLLLLQKAHRRVRPIVRIVETPFKKRQMAAYVETIARLQARLPAFARHRVRK